MPQFLFLRLSVKLLFALPLVVLMVTQNTWAQNLPITNRYYQAYKQSQAYKDASIQKTETETPSVSPNIPKITPKPTTTIAAASEPMAPTLISRQFVPSNYPSISIPNAPTEPSVPKPASIPLNVPVQYVIHFDYNKTTLSPEAIKILDSVVIDIRRFRPHAIQVTGHADTSGRDSYNLNLAEERVWSVTSYLSSKGIPKKLFSDLRAYGENKLQRPTTDNTASSHNRYVRITLIR